MTQAPGYYVDAEALRGYTNELGGFEAQTRSLGDQIGQVSESMSDTSWGIVGLFVKGKFDEKSQQLREFVHDTEKFLRSLDERVGSAAEQYDAMESTTRSTLDKIRNVVQTGGSSGGSGYGGGGYPGGGYPGSSESVQQFKQGTDGETRASQQEAGSWMSDASGFITQCMSSMGGAMDNPLKMLVGLGLDFLISIVSPLEDAIHYVSGDPDALQQGSGQFTSIAQGIDSMNSSFVDTSGQQLSGWSGSASVAAKKKLAEYSDRMDQVGSRSQSLAELLEASAYVMEIIEELIKSILTEFLTWLIMLWLPALAASVISFGSSIAAATTATTVQATTTVAKTTQKVVTLTDLLNALKNVLLKLALKLAKDGLNKLAGGDKGAGAQGTGPSSVHQPPQFGPSHADTRADAQREADERRRQAEAEAERRRAETEAEARRRAAEAQREADERQRQMQEEARRRQLEAQRQAEEQRRRMLAEAARRQQETQQRAREMQEQIRGRFDDFSPNRTSASGVSPGDFAGAGAGGTSAAGSSGMPAAGASAVGAGGLAAGAGSATGGASGAVAPGAPAASGVAGAGAGAGGARGSGAGGARGGEDKEHRSKVSGGGAGGMMGGGAGAGGQKGGEDKEHKRKYNVGEKASELFGDDEPEAPPVIEDK